MSGIISHASEETTSSVAPAKEKVLSVMLAKEKALFVMPAKEKALSVMPAKAGIQLFNQTLNPKFA